MDVETETITKINGKETSRKQEMVERRLAIVQDIFYGVRIDKKIPVGIKYFTGEIGNCKIDPNCPAFDKLSLGSIVEHYKYPDREDLKKVDGQKLENLYYGIMV